jgi:transposase
VTVRNLDRDIAVVKMVEQGISVQDIANELFFHANTIRRIKRRYREAQQIAQAELACLYPEEYRKRVEEIFTS